MLLETSAVATSAAPVRLGHSCLMPKASPDTQPQNARHSMETLGGSIHMVAHGPITNPNTMRECQGHELYITRWELTDDCLIL